MKTLHTARRVLHVLCLSALVTSLAVGPAAAAPIAARTQQRAPQVKNIIVMISDGMGYNQMAAGDYYLYGRAGASFAAMPFKSAMSTYSYYGTYDPAAAWASFDYVKSMATDSAAAATAMSTGLKTYDAAIGVDVNGQPVEHVMQAAERQGLATGVISTVEFSHATPAGFVAHNASRNNYTQIAEEMIMSSATDVVMGAGNPWFNDDGTARTSASYRYIGAGTWDALVNGTPTSDADGDGADDAWTLIQTRDEFVSLAEGETPERVCGVPQVATTLQQARPGDAYADAFEVPLTQNVPTLEEMTEGALNVLDNDEDGFVLMIEGGAVDWAGHANQTGRTIEEQVDFVNSYQAVNAWVAENSDWGETLLIVTGDHETGYLTGPGSGQLADGPVWNPIARTRPGVMPLVQWNSGSHTNSLIPFYAKGSAARFFKPMADETDLVRGRYIDNTEIADVCFDLIGD